MAEQDFERLLQTVRQLRTEVEALNAQMQQTGRAVGNSWVEKQGGTSPLRTTFEREYDQLERLTAQLREYETQLQAVALQRSRVWNQTGPGAGGAAGATTQAVPPQATLIPHPAGTTPPPTRTPYAPNLAPIADIRSDLNATNNSFKILNQRERIEQERLAVLREQLTSEKRYANALKMAEKQGYTLENLKGVRTRGTGNIQQVQFEKYNDFGIKENLDIFSSPSGRATAGLSNQFRTFGQGVIRDIGELTKWSLALAAVYGPLRKLGELTQEMIANQTKLAEATISVNSSFIDQAKVFDIAADSASQSGEAISGVIDAFTQAYRAAGSGSDQVERLTTAQKLLNDSLLLSKLSSLDQATAIDTLSAALRQSGSELEGMNDPLQKGSQLLDKWVRVTKVANVDLTTLATGFAVLGDAADAAGINVDQLNGLLAAIAETGIASGKEVANTARAIVSGFQSDQARKELENLGVAVTDTAGQMRPFLEIMKELSNLRKAGVIDDTQFSKLTLALGGGTRRQAAYATFIENFSRVYDVANESAQASGDAQEALAKQLDTVQTSLTKLANSFTVLAQTLGTDGGFLDIIQGSVTGIASMINVFDRLVAVLGKATPALAAFAAATIFLKSRGQGGISQVIGNFGQGLISNVDTEVALAQRLNGLGAGQVPTPKMSAGQRLGNFVGNNVLGTNAMSGGFQGLFLAAIPAITNALNARSGADKYGGIKATADIAGGIVGGIVGSLTGPQGALIGAALGTSIAEAFVNSTIARKTDIFGYQPTPLEAGVKPGGTTVNDRETKLRDAESNLYKSIGFGNEALGKLLTSNPQSRNESVFLNLNKAIEERDKEQFEKLLKGYGRGATTATGLSPAELRKAYAENTQLEVRPQTSAYSLASEQARKEYDAALKAYRVTSGNSSTETPFSGMVSKNASLYEKELNALVASSKEQLGQQRLSGDIKGSDYARRMGALEGFDTKALQYYTALGDEFIKVNDNVNNASEAFAAFNQIIVSGTGDTVPEITQIVGEIEKLVNILNDPALQTKDMLESFGFKNLDEVSAKLKELRGTGASLLSDVYGQSQLSNLKVPQIEGLQKPLTTGENVLVEQRTKQLQDNFYQGFLKLPDAMYDALKDSFDEFAVTIKDSGDEFYKSVSETDQQFRQAAIQQLQDEGKLASQKENPFNIQQLDITSQQGAGLQGSIDYFSKYLAQNFPQYKQNPEDVGVIFSDYVTSVLHGDNLAIKLALEKIVDLNQKQLDGMYNIPEGATFWVPLQAAYYRPKDQGGLGDGMPSVEGLPDNTTATNNNTRALEQLSSVMSNTDRLKLEYPDKQVPNKYDPYGIAQRAEPNNRDIPVTKYAPGGIANPYDPRAFSNESRMEAYTKLIENYGKELAAGQKEPVVGYRGDPGYGREAQGQAQSFIEQLKQGLLNFFGQSQGGYQGFGHNGMAPGPNETGVRPLQQEQLNQVTPTVQARMDLRFDNSVQLIVDGRVLASVVTPYLASDLVKMEASQGTITKRYVI